MVRRKVMGAVLAVVVGAGVLVVGPASSGTIIDATSGTLRAGVGVVDLSWNVGRNQGQLGPAGNMLTGDDFDPYVHTVTQEPTNGIQARLSARALVVEDPDGNRVAYLKSDHYLQQDLLYRRVAQLVEEAGIGIDRDNLMIGATHNHSAPYGATTSWGVWAFADAFDLREFDYFATRMAQAVIDAAESLRPVRMGASVGTLTEVQQNILGPATADDGTPAGFPRDHFDPELAVIRFDDVSDPEHPAPYAMLVNLAMHPESLDGNGMLSPDFVGQVELHAERATGATVIWSQGGLGDVEPDRDARANPPELRREYWRRDFSQMEEMSRTVASRVAETYDAVAAGVSTVSGKDVPFTTEATVGMTSMRFPGPASHPVPTVSNCRTEAASRGRPGLPAAGLPDCSRQDGPDVGPLYDAVTDAGLPVVENYGSSPGYLAAQETLHAHLQVMRLGEILLATCPCEPVTDMTLNFKTRTDAAAPEMHLGWVPTCAPEDADTYLCERPNRAWEAPSILEVPADRHDRMMAQILNDARGWDDETPEAIATAEAEPTDPAQIKGNFTHERIQDLACGEASCPGYRLPLMVGTANDYIGYVVTYREYQRGDHYRKALTAFGPHTADYINTRLVGMAAGLQGADEVAAELLDATVEAEDVYLHARARVIGESARAARAAYEAALPDDGGSPAIVMEPSTLERFDGAQVRWIGGSNYTDNPRVRVEGHDEHEGWVPFAGQDGGEVVVTYEYARSQDLDSWTGWAAGDHVAVWTASLEVFEQTPPGTYRFVIDGHHRQAGAPQDYALTSEAFDVDPWTGIRVASGSFDPGTGEARFTVAPLVYPDTWEPVAVPYISTDVTEVAGQTYCFRCTFRPWATGGEVDRAQVTVETSQGTHTMPATLVDGEWVVTGIPSDADAVHVDVGDVIDVHGNVNGERFTLPEA